MKNRKSYQEVLAEVLAPITAEEVVRAAAAVTRDKERKRVSVQPAPVAPSLSPLTPNSKLNPNTNVAKFGPKLAQRRERRHALKAKRNQ